MQISIIGSEGVSHRRAFRLHTKKRCCKRNISFLCGRRDSNPHALRHQILSLAWLPITTRPLQFINLFYLKSNLQTLTVKYVLQLGMQRYKKKVLIQIILKEKEVNYFKLHIYCINNKAHSPSPHSPSARSATVTFMAGLPATKPSAVP